jgi:hypothetical protein
MPITREYLEGQLANLTRQAEQASVTLHNANGAIAATRHLLEVMDRDETPDSAAVPDAAPAAPPADQPQEAADV